MADHTPITELVRDQEGDYLVIVEELEESHSQMLAALEAAVDWIVDSFPNKDDQPNSIVDDARTAIARAKGI